MFSYPTLFTPACGILAARFSKTVLVLSLALLLPLSAHAGTLDVGDALNPGLNVGDTFHLTFTTDGTFQVNQNVAPEMATFDGLVQAAADTGGLTSGAGLSWSAIVSTDCIFSTASRPSAFLLRIGKHVPIGSPNRFIED